MNEQQVSEPTKAAPEQPLTAIGFNKEHRTWRFTFKDPAGEEFTYELAMKKSLFNTSLYMHISNKDKIPSVLVSGKLVKEDGSLAEVSYQDRIFIPNLWPDRDIHTVLSKDESIQLIISVIRDTNFEVIKRSVSDWLINEVQRSGAINFKLLIKDN